MDMSFANQALSAEWVVANGASLERRVYDVPKEIDEEIARLKLATMGIEIDTLTEEQARYLEAGTRARRGEACLLPLDDPRPHEVDAGTRETLERFGFDPALFEQLRARVASGELSPASNIVDGTVEPPRADDLTRLPEPGEDGYEQAHEAGLEALRAGAVAQVVLAGGMATRFGGVVKAVVEAVDGRSFLEIKLAETLELERALGAQVPVALMTSFATDDVIRDYVAERDLGEPLRFHQFVSLRLEPDGDLFRDGEGRPSLYAPGHGDLFRALRESGALGELRASGVRVVDRLERRQPRRARRPLGDRAAPARRPAVHRRGGAQVRATWAAPRCASTGGCSSSRARASRRRSTRISSPSSTRTPAVFDLDALDRDFDLTWLYVAKTADGRPAVQLERVYHEASAFLPTTYLEVPRRGPRGRFFPIKTPEDLADAQDDLRELLAASLI